jgi:hypothetical protein
MKARHGASSARSAMFIVSRRHPLSAKLRRSGMRLDRIITQTQPGTPCRSYGAWLDSGADLTINMALLTELAFVPGPVRGQRGTVPMREYTTSRLPAGASWWHHQRRANGPLTPTVSPSEGERENAGTGGSAKMGPLAAAHYFPIDT